MFMHALLPLLTLSTPALAARGGRAPGLRVKLSQGLYTHTTARTDIDGDTGDPATTSTFNLLSGAPRAELTWRFENPRGLEAGIIGGFQQSKSTFDGDDLASSTAYTALGTLAWNFDMGMARAFIQPMGGVQEVRLADDVGDTDVIATGWVLGGDVGLRVKLFKRVSFDPAFELLKSASTLRVDGDAVDDRVDHQTAWGLRWGISVLL
jgi:hypothetical protein